MFIIYSTFSVSCWNLSNGLFFRTFFLHKIFQFSTKDHYGIRRIPKIYNRYGRFMEKQRDKSRNQVILPNESLCKTIQKDQKNAVKFVFFVTIDIYHKHH